MVKPDSKSRPFRIAIFMLLLSLALARCAASERRPQPVPEGAASFEVMTYNVNYGLAGDPATLNVLRRATADTVFLQETTPAWEALIRGDPELAHTFPWMEFRHSGGAGGLGVISKRPFEVRDFVPSPSGWFPALRVVLDTPLGEVQALVVHLHPPVSESGSFASGYFTTGSVRLDEIEAFARTLEPGLPTIVAGDFNEDYDGGALRSLRARGLRSVLQEYDPRAKTWRWNTRLGTITQTLDHVCYDAALEPVEARVVQEGRSDHVPVVARFMTAGPNVRCR